MLLKKNVKLILEDGSVFYGVSFGAEKNVSGEVVFNTGMVSYKGQILCLTYPLIGNYGVPSWEKDIYGIPRHFESSRIQVQALVVSDYSFDYSHWNAAKSLAEWLKDENIPGIYGIDTRALTKKLREKGAMLGKVFFNGDIDFFDPNAIDIVKEVTIKKPVVYNLADKTNSNINNTIIKNPLNNKNIQNKKIILIDCGVKNNIIRSLLQRNVSVIRA